MHGFSKHTLFFILVVFFLSSCRSKKTFNAVEALRCTTFDETKKSKKVKKSSKYEIVVLKDGKRMGNKKRKKRGKNRLFK